MARRLSLAWLPHVLLALWLTYLGLAVWEHAKRSEYPPIYDGLTYFQKAQNFWNNFHQEQFINPLNLHPVSRPPGTVLMSYPFGFDNDFRPFHFRSVFLPVLCLIAAIYLVGYSGTMPMSRQWSLVFLVGSASTLPMFYQFERVDYLPSNVYWGLVDGFLAGIAAIAAAASVRSLKERSLSWLLAASWLAGLCILIKPAGIVIMVFIALTWFVSCLWQLRYSAGQVEDRRAVVRLIRIGPLLIGTAYAAVLLACMSSAYLSPYLISFGTRAMHILQTDGTPPLTFSAMHDQLHTSFGHPLLLSLTIIIVFGTAYWRRLPTVLPGWPRGTLGGLVVTTCLDLAVGMEFWVVETGWTQVRYFYPFAMMAGISIVPIAIGVLGIMPRWGMIVFRTVCFMPLVLLALLLGQSDPSPKWQRMAGINLSTGTSVPELSQARALLGEIRKNGRDAKMYSVRPSEVDAAFTSVAYYEQFLAPTAPQLVMRGPVDWQRPNMHRQSEILTSDYLLFIPVTDTSVKAQVLAEHSISTFSQEGLLFRSWLTDLTKPNGVTLVSQTSARVLKVADRRRLEVSLADLIAKHSWHPTFGEANPRHWWSPRDLAEATRRQSPKTTDVRFGELFSVHALSIAQNSDSTTVRFWWEPISERAGDGWTLFFHWLDSKGVSIANQEVPLDLRPPLAPSEPIRLDVTTLTRTALSDPTTMAFGIYRPTPAPPTFLQADKGRRDWDNRRVLVPLPKPS